MPPIPVYSSSIPSRVVSLQDLNFLPFRNKIRAILHLQRQVLYLLSIYLPVVVGVIMLFFIDGMMPLSGGEVGGATCI